MARAGLPRRPKSFETRRFSNRDRFSRWRRGGVQRHLAKYQDVNFPAGLPMFRIVWGQFRMQSLGAKPTRDSSTCHRYRELKPLLRLIDRIEGIEAATGFAYGRV